MLTKSSGSFALIIRIDVVIPSTGLNFGALVFSLNKECCFSIDAASGAVSLVTPLDRDGKSGAPLHRCDKNILIISTLIRGRLGICQKKSQF